ncbi:metallophosphoesterase family protein [Methylomonas sp. MS20]|uniref:metallophosphoesterase family protein n=1 Tax=unclassified Methylomonas TaxID=2608980 RepID=UPI0028A451A6|nr:metallophosphoesterase [Methylomonas sp. MV1]MDT4332729.1 metallophosphoesterase [Methylomonas sp. MV1]
MRRFFLVHLSDLHITGPEAEDALCTLTSAVSKELDNVRMKTGSAVYLIITGDLVSAPTTKAITTAKNYVESLEKELPLSHPPLIVPGNHDVKKMGGSIWKDDQSFFDAFPSSLGVWHKSFVTDGLEVIGLDSNGKANFARGKLNQNSYNGLLKSSNELARKIRDAKAARTDEEAGELRILALHHHPLPLAAGEGFKELGFIPDEGFMYLQSPATFLGAAMSFDCHVILHGHRHVSGLARYSIPNDGIFTRDYLSEDEAWSTIYVLSCPSSTGVSGDDAGFNILEFVEKDGLNSYRPELKLYRFTRPLNAFAFKPLDKRGVSNCIRLPLGEDVQRDFAITVFWKVSAIREDIWRNDLLSMASSLFRRRAFQRIDEEDWAEALYVYTATANAWSEVVRRLKEKDDVDAGNDVFNALLLLQDASAVALDVKGALFDDLRKHIFNRRAYDGKMPRRSTEKTCSEGRKKKHEALEQLRIGLQRLGVEEWLPEVR